MKQINSIKQTTVFIAVMCMLGLSANAQLSGAYTVGGTSPDYSTLSAAISALNTSGVSGPVEFLIRDGSYSGSSWMGSINNISGASSTNRITFRSQSNDKTKVTITNNSSSNYIFRFNNARYITVKALTLVKNTSSYCRVFDFGSTAASYDSVVNCTIQANAIQSSSNSRCLVYGYGHTGTDNVFLNNEFKNGGQWLYLRGSGSSSPSNNMMFYNNKFTATNSGYYGFYTYYTSGLKFHDNEFTRTGSSTYYFSYSYYLNNDFEFIGNTVNISSTGTMYGMHFYYMNYITNSSTLTPKVHNNTFNMTNSSGTSYPFYTYYAHHASYLNNTVNVTHSSGYIRGYGPLYYNRNSRAEGNTINYNMTSTSSGYIYNQYMAYNSGNYPDTFVNNNVILHGRYVYNYIAYYGNTIITDNNYDASSKYGYVYNYLYYANGIEFANNKIKAYSSSYGTIYGLYENGSSSYSGAKIHHNDIEAYSSSGTVYGIYSYYSKSKYYNNLITTKTPSSSYLLRVYYNYSSLFKNNTFHSLSTGSTNYLAYIYNTSSSYKTTLNNNIFSRSSSTNDGIYIYNKNYFKADYNLYYIPSGNLFRCNSPSYSGNSLQSWRDKTGSDMNSLVYEPAYTNAANRDMTIDANSPSAWAVNGRAEHDSTLGPDLANNVRPKLPADGVPDLGAYEVDPTSTPPNADATPANPVANSTQVFTFGQDTVATIDWGSSVPTTYTMRQYTGIQAAPMPMGVGRMFFYAAGTPSSWIHSHTPHVYYKDPWIGDIPGETEAVPARSSNNGAWEGYNYTNAQLDIKRNILSTTNPLDSVGGYTGVQNGRIGIRCVENPKNVVISNITAFAADVDWDPVFNPIGYQVVLKQKNEAPSVSDWNNATLPTSNSLALGGLTEDTKYFVYIRSICGVKDTSGYTMDSFTTLITCHTPAVKVTGVNDSRVISYWDTVKTATKYEYVMTTSSTAPTYGTDLSKNSVLAPFLDDNTVYYVYVRAHCSSIYNQSEWGKTSFTTWKVGVGNVSSTGKGLNIYPNPVHADMVVTIGGEMSDNATVSVLDMTGRVLKTVSANGNKVTVPVAELPAGMYMVQYVDDHRREQIKFNKQ